MFDNIKDWEISIKGSFKENVQRLNVLELMKIHDTIEYEYIVYKTTNLINNKIYIGVHRTIKNINDGYIGCGVCGKVKKGKGFIAAVAKYGYENFKRETLFSYPDTEEGKLQAYKKEAELVNWDFIRDKNTYNLKLGGRVSSSVRQRQIAQYDLDGNLIKVWNNIAEIVRANIAPSSSISHCCNKETYSNKWQWRYYDGTNKNINKVTPKIRPVYQFDLQGNYITYYKSIREASEATLINPTLISNVCTNHQYQAGGYFWSYKKRFTYIPPDKKIAVACYEDDGSFIRSFTSLAEAAEYYKVHYSAITRCIQGKTKHSAKVRWRYFYGNTSKISSL